MADAGSAAKLSAERDVGSHIKSPRLAKTVGTGGALASVKNNFR